MCYIQLYWILLYSISHYLCILFFYNLDGVYIYVHVAMEELWGSL